jgi:hypothetical protein
MTAPDPGPALSMSRASGAYCALQVGAYIQ